MLEQLEVLIYMQALLANIAGSSGVYRGVAPDTALPPYIVIAHQGGSDVMAVNGFRLLDDSLYQAKAVGHASDNTTLVSIARDIDTTLQRSAGTTTAGRILMMVRERPFVLDQNVNKVIWTSIGGFYRGYCTDINN